MIAASHAVPEAVVPPRPPVVLPDAEFAAAAAAVRRLAVPWFQLVDLREPDGRAGTFPRRFLLEQVRGPALGDFALLQAQDGVVLLLVPAGEDPEREVLALGTLASLGEAMAVLDDFLRRVTDGHPDLGGCI